MEANWIEELEAQVEEHGWEAVRIYFDSGDMKQPLYVNDVSFDDGEIKVIAVPVWK